MASSTLIASTEDEGSEINFFARELKLFQMILRIFGFWQPIHALFIERWLYPLLVNFMFFLICILEVIYWCTGYPKAIKLAKTEKNYDLLFDLAVRLTVDVYAWFCHVFTLAYFRRRDIERSLLILVDFDESLIARCSKMKNRLLIIVFITLFIDCLVSLLTIYNASWLDTTLKSNATSKVNTLAYVINIVYLPFNFYLIPVSMSLTWVVYLLYEVSKLRLAKLKEDFLKWERPIEDAIYQFQNYYSLKVYQTCADLRLLFIVHNAIMVILTPMFCYLCLEILKKQNSFHFAIFVLLCTQTVLSWIVPLLLAGAVASNEYNFRSDINKFCPGYIHDRATNISMDDLQRKTFSSRSEVNKMLVYLKERQSGFIIFGYSFQLKLSMWSFYFGLILFVIKLFV